VKPERDRVAHPQLPLRRRRTELLDHPRLRSTAEMGELVDPVDRRTRRLPLCRLRSVGRPIRPRRMHLDGRPRRRVNRCSASPRIPRRGLFAGRSAAADVREERKRDERQGQQEKARAPAFHGAQYDPSFALRGRSRQPPRGSRGKRPARSRWPSSPPLLRAPPTLAIERAEPTHSRDKRARLASRDGALVEASKPVRRELGPAMPWRAAHGWPEECTMRGRAPTGRGRRQGPGTGAGP
jgi:hypothetical protein